MIILYFVAGIVVLSLVAWVSFNEGYKAGVCVTGAITILVDDGREVEDLTWEDVGPVFKQFYKDRAWEGLR